MRDIKGFEGLYAVTSCGRVWSYRNNKFLKPGTDRGGYQYVILCKNGYEKTVMVHRLIAKAYIPNPENLLFINHKDEVKTHNWIGNLEWCTREYNNNYGTRNARVAEKLGTKIQCKETGEIFDSMGDCQRKLGCDSSAISKQIRGKLNHVKGFHFIKIE